MSEKAWLLSQELKMTFTQDTDCCSNEEQFLTIFTDNGGGGDFFVIETKRWSFDNIEEFIRILYEFKKSHDKIKLKEDDKVD
jgi:hypothetical protein